MMRHLQIIQISTLNNLYGVDINNPNIKKKKTVRCVEYKLIKA